MAERRRPMEDITGEVLRGIARQAEEQGLRALADYSDFAPPLQVGDTKNSPQESAQDRAALLGLQVLREDTERLVAKLYTLAAARDRGEEVPPVLLEPFRGLIDAYRARPNAAEGEPSNRRAR
jgi:hypothetical protein